MIYENVKNIRIARGITKRHMAKGINVTEMTYGRIECGKSKLSVEHLKIIATLLSVPVAIFFDDKLTESVINEISKATLEKQLA
ncbi:helix-turn-helix domain-containing protein [Lysinibacillus sphaericus]|uniref:helix-turn-helix domain-containing protein n=1 Tax=Lysinibacillus sphaericus TaxID=1421 RepID=UPI0004DF52DA|nr:helix-turn-helix transcriptional regulator [Lysinibacillus sphaericus]QPA60651.1 helix-turn-helix transcriptional regulator [Lysinibacillus sphaericus]